MFTPLNAAELSDLVRSTVAEGAALALHSGNSLSALGHPPRGDRPHHSLSLAGFDTIIAYEPDELVLTVGPGIPMAEVKSLLVERGQHLAFEPPDWGPLYGQPAGIGTLGGTLGAALAGSRRVTAGSARDHMLGFHAVNGRGEIFKAGGRVVKNVTGYDLPKLVTGAFGTLVALTEVTVKVVPAPETVETLMLPRLNPALATKLMSQALGSPHDVGSAAYLPASVARDLIPGTSDSATLIRLEGFAASVEARAAALMADLGVAVERLGAGVSRTLWQALSDAAPLVGLHEDCLWRISVPPTEGAAILEAVQAARPLATGWLDWGGGLIWLALPAHPGEGDGGAAFLRGLVKNGHATLIRAPERVRTAVPVFQPMPPALAALARRLKASFDPHAVFNPSRLGA
ncbi:FAD-binding protein [Elstera sp.]|jgi:glycolate oxidase FAD binding subunit|uniref:FAD-binding protein n=1 Tax=Elstera sp. TaxID=1916664 RepID=UPI0037C0555E